MCKHNYYPNQIYPKGTSFTYLISWTELNISYYGVRYSKDCHPDDLWINYFTSSIPVENFRKLNGEPDIIKIDFTYDSGDEARLAEYQFIKENNCVRDPKWLNLCNGGEDYCCTGHTNETRQKMSESHTGKSSGMLGKHHSEENIKRLSDLNKGSKHSEETLIKMRKPKKSKDNYKNLKKGFIWINNGIDNKMIDPAKLLEFPEWVCGIKEETKQKNRDSQKNRVVINNGVQQKQIKMESLQEYLDLEWVKEKLKGIKKGDKGLPHSEATKLKLSEHFKGTRWMNNGLKSKQIKPENIQEQLNQGWNFGRLKYHK